MTAILTAHHYSALRSRRPSCRCMSQGKFLKVQPADATDGYDTIEWLARQPWSNGKTGAWGQSFAARAQR